MSLLRLPRRGRANGVPFRSYTAVLAFVFWDQHAVDWVGSMDFHGEGIYHAWEPDDGTTSESSLFLRTDRVHVHGNVAAGVPWSEPSQVLTKVDSWGPDEVVHSAPLIVVYILS